MVTKCLCQPGVLWVTNFRCFLLSSRCGTGRWWLIPARHKHQRCMPLGWLRGQWRTRRESFGRQKPKWHVWHYNSADNSFTVEKFFARRQLSKKIKWFVDNWPTKISIARQRKFFCGLTKEIKRNWKGNLIATQTDLSRCRNLLHADNLEKRKTRDKIYK